MIEKAAATDRMAGVEGDARWRETQLAEIFNEMKAGGAPVGMSNLGSQEDVWKAIREFFRDEAEKVAA